MKNNSLRLFSLRFHSSLQLLVWAQNLYLSLDYADESGYSLSRLRWWIRKSGWVMGALAVRLGKKTNGKYNEHIHGHTPRWWLMSSFHGNVPRLLYTRYSIPGSKIGVRLVVRPPKAAGGRFCNHTCVNILKTCVWDQINATKSLKSMFACVSILKICIQDEINPENASSGEKYKIVYSPHWSCGIGKACLQHVVNKKGFTTKRCASATFHHLFFTLLDHQHCKQQAASEATSQADLSWPTTHRSLVYMICTASCRLFLIRIIW